MTQPPLTDRTQAGVAFLDDARKRRKRRPKTPLPAEPAPDEEPQGAEFGAEDSSAFALDLAAELLDEQPEAAGGADAILAQHEAAAEAPASPPAADERGDDAPADEILLALEGQHQRAEPRQRRLAPRGSADLAAHQAQRPRTKPPTTRPTFRRPRPSRRLLAGGALAAALVAIATTMGSNSPSTSSKTAAHLTPISTSTFGAAIAAGNFPAPGHLAARHRQTASTSKNAHHRARRAKTPAPRHPNTGTAATSSRSHTLTASSATANSAGASNPSYTATPAASDSQGTSGSPSESQSSGSSGSPQPAGPAGAGGTVGGNCNPKCS
jgi:hypothetical protein